MERKTLERYEKADSYYVGLNYTLQKYCSFQTIDFLGTQLDLLQLHESKIEYSKLYDLFSRLVSFTNVR